MTDRIKETKPLGDIKELFWLVRQNRITLQLPELFISIKDGKSKSLRKEIFETFPKEWFQLLKDKRKPFGKESGYLYLSKIGWEENKEVIKELFEESIKDPKFFRGHDDWKKFEEFADDFFKTVEIKTTKFRDRLLKNLEAY